MSAQDQNTAVDYETIAAQTLAAVQAGGPDRVVGAELDMAPLQMASLHTAHGTTTFATAFIWGTVDCNLTFDSGESMNFNGTHWGVGLGGGTSYGVAVFSVPARSLVGGGTYEVHSQAGIAGYVQVNFFKDGSLVGNFTGAALAVNVSIGGGSGTWKLV